MALYHLDPRQAGTGAAPDVWITTGPMIGDKASGFRAIDKRNKAPLAWGETESAALTAARQAAGFGHVAERACSDPYYDYHDEPDDCGRCAWPRDAHQVTP